MNIFFARHGQTSFNRDNKMQGLGEIPLTTEGEKYIHNVAVASANYKINRIYVSNILRAKQTAKIYQNTFNASVKIDDRLNEIDVGDFEGKLFNLVAAGFMDHNTYKVLEDYGCDAKSIFKDTPAAISAVFNPEGNIQGDFLWEKEGLKLGHRFITCINIELIKWWKLSWTLTSSLPENLNGMTSGVSGVWKLQGDIEDLQCQHLTPEGQVEA